MGIANLGAPIGAYLTTVTAGAGHEQLLFWLLGSLFAAAYCWSFWAQPVYLYTDDDEVAGGTQHAGLT